jgi:hypothetical protein
MIAVLSRVPPIDAPASDRALLDMHAVRFPRSNGAIGGSSWNL